MFTELNRVNATWRFDRRRSRRSHLLISALVFSLGSLFASVAWSFSPDQDLTARAAVLMDAATGKILYQKDADLRLPPASTTKVMTAILALESGRKLTETLTVSKTATRVPASKLYLRPGQSLAIEDLLYAIMLSSANDASMVLAEGIGGSVEHFTELMTKRAHELGATNSHFANPHGLTAVDHFSTARDLAVLFRYAMRNPTFREIVQTKISSVSSNTIVKKRTVARRISVRNHNRLLWNFDGAIGGKTGYTHAAQKCFVGAVARNGTTLVVSVLGARDQWGDTKRLLEYGFDNYESLKAAPQPDSKTAPTEPASIRPEGISAVMGAPRENSRGQPVNGYVLQLGAFRERGRAESLLKQFSDRGWEGFVEKILLSPGETAYRVRFGPYAELLVAQQMAQEILQKSGYQALIMPFLASPESGGEPS
ncbi:MAG: D-alanyl-D-alanine carboxypeptidase [Deltaproteobacteria bacterium]|nr:D-alanyl-D-alanine carboxypeptidase [Deltaproteobacteria bacterium]MBI2179781.1 D-alanyl-D-alanine carboxypeptidase [Deltaproteobacteria bacterium]MBI2531725.1 D-alanyl-D-alanine carboxypeptidase [Deltaproteobacteria bacterium]MBI3065102.1 D-alanyl-D-alanine carboxypeptidase [Deltaproteobacteria bacterium]